MNKGIVLVDVVMVLVILIPITYLIIYTVGGEKKVKKNIHKLCRSNGIKLNQLEINGDLILGLDSEHRKLVVSERKNLETGFQIIDLNIIVDCSVKVLRSTKKMVDWVGLELVSFEFKKDIQFYKEDDVDGSATDSQVSEQQALKWEKIIKPYLKAS